MNNNFGKIYSEIALEIFPVLYPDMKSGYYKSLINGKKLSVVDSYLHFFDVLSALICTFEFTLTANSPYCDFDEFKDILLYSDNPEWRLRHLYRKNGGSYFSAYGEYTDHIVFSLLASFHVYWRYINEKFFNGNSDDKMYLSAPIELLSVSEYKFYFKVCFPILKVLHLPSDRESAIEYFKNRRRIYLKANKIDDFDSLCEHIRFNCYKFSDLDGNYEVAKKIAMQILWSDFET